MDNLYVLKFGGNAIRGKEDLARLSSEIASMKRDGARIILVHGGGPEISEEMERRGLKPEKVCGVRITDADALDVAETVLRRINADVVDSLAEAGVTAVGLPAYHCTLCAKKAPMKVVEDGVSREVDLGLVGEVKDADPSTLEDLLADDVLPVIYPIGKDGQGRKLNVNADTMAAGIASAVGCVEMVAITDVPGILRDVSDPGSKIDSLSMAEVESLIADGTISGGMIPKVEACTKALLAGVPAVRMVNGKGGDGILSGLSSRGTVITR
ncbi:MAG: acetylglutamate kinase [Candidatus Methanomethylophilaceae archaeon]|jgi:acetylglutamate kinase|nr:acetylglutamate kinase [Candidatus Methanomethylophilaceae archaeon]